jgi:hypothetical protein
MSRWRIIRRNVAQTGDFGEAVRRASLTGGDNGRGKRRLMRAADGIAVYLSLDLVARFTRWTKVQ